MTRKKFGVSQVIHSLVFILGMIFILNISSAVKVQAATQTGEFERAPGLSYSYDTDTKTLTISGTSSVTYFEEGWMPKELRNNVVHVKFENCSVMSLDKFFYSMYKLETIDFSNLDTSGLTSAYAMCYACPKLTSINFNGFDTSNVTNTSRMFYECKKLENMDISGFKTSKVTTMTEMFMACNSLKNIDLSGFDTSNVIHMENMFSGCKSLIKLDLSSFDMTGLSMGSMYGVFYGCAFDTILTPKDMPDGLELPIEASQVVQGFTYKFYYNDEGGNGTTVITSSLVNQTLQKVKNGWCRMNGNYYWFENGIKQGTSNPKGTEIYDPSTDAWYWLEIENDGARATSKDVEKWYWEPRINNMVDGWYRYDKDGKLVKGWQYSGAGTYYFDEATGKRAHGAVTINGKEYHFNEDTGILDGTANPDFKRNAASESVSFEWVDSGDGKDYWYEDGVRQGYDPNNPDYRGKEIYDPTTNAWYWLDNVQQGAVAKDKDVYQDSSGGKWVRYDADGGMIKGEDCRYGGWYRFDLVTGAMIKGWYTADNGKVYYYDNQTGKMIYGQQNIDGKDYYFDEVTGIRK